VFAALKKNIGPRAWPIFYVDKTRPSNAGETG